MHRPAWVCTRQVHSAEKKNGHETSSLTQKLSLIDNHSQRKISVFFNGDLLYAFTTLRSGPRAQQQMAFLKILSLKLCLLSHFFLQVFCLYIIISNYVFLCCVCVLFLCSLFVLFYSSLIWFFICLSVF